MEPLLYRNKEYVPISTAAKLINSKVGMIYYYISNNKVRTLDIDRIKLIELDSLLLLNDYLQFRRSKNNPKKNGL